MTRIFFWLLVIMTGSLSTWGQCGRISLIGEFNGWAEDVFLTRDLTFSEEFSGIIILTEGMDTNGDGIIEMKFRENGDWTNNWGASLFPNGTAVPNGPNIPVPIGSYQVSFNCNTLVYNFTLTCGAISLIGEFSGWASDLMMTRDPVDPDLWTIQLALDENSNSYDPPNIIEMKFRENNDWTVNWGASEFPSGFAYQDGPNIPVPLTYTGITTDYHVTFNCSTGEYTFVETSGPISLKGEFNEYGTDLYFKRNASNVHEYSVLLTLHPYDDHNGDGVIDIKFRENADWSIQWGGSQFPSGTAQANGPYIQVPLDGTGITTDYVVHFDDDLLTYSFVSTSGAVSVTGEFIGWTGDIPFHRSLEYPDEWSLTRCWTGDSEVKFRENNDWVVNWGAASWPSGTAIPNGPNIPLEAGTYDVSFNSSTYVYNFINNPDACGEIGIIGDFNNWGGSGTYPTDVYMVRDPVIPTYFHISYTFSQSTNILFRLDADPAYYNVWGGNTLCQTGIQDPSMQIPVPAGVYDITFDFNSGDYCLISQTKSLEAPKVFAANIDGELSEPEWIIDQELNKVTEGYPDIDPNSAFFGVIYDDDYLFVGIQVSDMYVTDNELIEVFVDGNNSKGEYDEHDVYFTLDGAGSITVMEGPPGIEINGIFAETDEGYVVECAISLADLAVIPQYGNMIGIDIMMGDDDLGYIEYRMAWNGSMINYSNTDLFGKLIFGNIDCGCISLYNPEVGDIILRTPTDQPTTFLATFDFENDFGMVFRKDRASNIIWGSDDFPSGIAELGGPEIPVLTGRYRIHFDCLTSEFSFEDAPAGENVAMAAYTEDPPVIDGDLSEYSLEYDCNNLVVGTGPVNNIVNWSVLWDFENFYIGASVIDSYVAGNGNPWDNDAIEFYIDGNNDKDGIYDGDFDTQIILDVLNQNNPWFKAEGVTVNNYDVAFVFTDYGYNVEMLLGWDNFSFEPGRGRVMGWSLGNDDNDFNIGRDYQTVWYGTVSNWSNTADLGDLQLADGPYVGEKEPVKRNSMIIFPNPTSGITYLKFDGSFHQAEAIISIIDLAGREIYLSSENSLSPYAYYKLDLGHLQPGVYLVRIMTYQGDLFTKKVIVK